MKVDLVGIVGLLLALLSSFGLASLGDPERAARGRSMAVDVQRGRTIEDARGEPVLAARYSRVASMNPLADHLLVQLLETDRLVAVSELAAEGHPESWRFAGLQRTTSDDSVEQILELRPDLVVASSFVDEAVLARLRELGVATVDPGPMRGIETTLATIESLGIVLEVEGRAATLAERYLRELAALETAAELRGRTAGMYLAVYGDTFFGGTSGTSYGDVLHHGGIHDVAAAAGHEGWPQYSAEQLISLDPELIVTQEGMAPTLREHPVTAKLRAVRRPGGIVELPKALNSDAGLGVVLGAHILGRALEHRPGAAVPANPESAPDAPLDR